MKYEALCQYLANMEKAEEEMTDLFQRVDELIKEMDEDDLLLPGDYNEEERYIVWPLAKTYDPDIYEVNDEEEDEEPEEVEDEEEFEEEEEDFPVREPGEDIICEVGLALWSPKPGEAVASVYAVLFGSHRLARWKKAKEIERDLEGKIYLNHEEWTEDMVELRQFSLCEDLDLREVAKAILEAAEALEDYF